MKDLYVSFCESAKKAISYSTFCDCKPFYVVKKDLKERDTCLCEKCENMQLMLESLHRAQAIEVNSTLALARSVSCLEKTDLCYQRECAECKAKEIPFKQCDDEKKSVKYCKWVRVTEERKDSRTDEVKEVKRVIKKSFESTVEDLKNILKENFRKYMSHLYRDTHQTQVLREKRENLGSEEMYIWQDFSENYNCKYDREIQSHYYGASRQQVTLHTGVVYLQNLKKAFCTLSECLRHDPPAIIAHILPILNTFMTPEIRTLHFQSDSPTTQYRNKLMFWFITQYLPRLFPQLEKIVYNYTEAGHGKGGPDGTGGAMKTAADAAVTHGEDVHNFETLVSVLQKKCPNIFQASITVDEVVKISEKQPSSLESFKGTMDVHQFIWNKEVPKIVQFKSVSCYQSQCEGIEECAHFKMKNSPWILGRGNDPEEREPSPDTAPDSSPDQLPIPAPVPGLPAPVKVGDWVVVTYGQHWYPGYVEKVASKKATVDFMVKNEKLDEVFLWPPKPDKQAVSKADILYRLRDPPKLIDRQHYIINDDEKSAIDDLLSSKRG